MLCYGARVEVGVLPAISAACVFAVSLTSVAAGSAQDSAPAQAPAPTLSTGSAPPVNPPPARAQAPVAVSEVRSDDGTWRHHDGFYLRLGIGIGFGRVNSTGEFGERGSDALVDFDAQYSGIGAAYELLIGGTPGSGVVVGGGFVGQDISDPKVESGFVGLSNASSASSDGSLGLLLLGPFIDWFPAPKGGFHVGAMLGIATIGLSSSQTDDDLSDGFGGSLWTGYDFWIGEQWSLGSELRAAFLSTHRELDEQLVSGEINDTGSSFELLFTALYH